jgi:predicted murein hydrolase (TIGR00659 family)
MSEMLSGSVYFGVTVSLAAYGLGAVLRKRWRFALCNPLLIAVVVTMAALCALHIDYDSYYQGAKYLSYLLTPATVSLAIPLYEQLPLLKRHKGTILLGVASGVLTSLVTVLALSLLLGLDHRMYVTLLPKSITTAIGMGVSEKLGGYVTITVAVIIITGIFGNIIAGAVCRLFRVTEPVARGVAIGSASHAIGTARAMEMGEIEGAMSSLSLAVSGVLTVFAASVYAQLLP